MNRLANTIIVLILACGAFIATPAIRAQTTWYVDEDSPGDPGPGDPAVSDPLEDGSAAHPFDAIQEGIDAASGGDTVLVADGTYTGTGNRDIDFNGKAITVRSENGAENCIIDCENNGCGFYFHNGEGQDAVLRGFTIQNGWSGVGGGIYCELASPTIVHNTIQNNTAWDFSGGGGGIFCVESPVIKWNIITNNYSNYRGGGICTMWGSPLIEFNTIIWNHALYYGGGIGCYGSSALIMNNIISNNGAGAEGSAGHGGGIYNYSYDGVSPTIKNNLIINNSAFFDGGGVYGCEIINCTVANNSSDYGTGGVHCIAKNCIIWGNNPDQVSGDSIITYSDVEDGHPGTGNINADPLFITGPMGDYYLDQLVLNGLPFYGSPCVDAGDPASEIMFGTTCLYMTPDIRIIDMGYHYPIQSSSRDTPDYRIPAGLLQGRSNYLYPNISKQDE